MVMCTVSVLTLFLIFIFGVSVGSRTNEGNVNDFSMISFISGCHE